MTIQKQATSIKTRLLKSDYINTGGGCMVMIDEVFIYDYKMTVWVYTDNDTVVVSAVNYLLDSTICDIVFDTASDLQYDDVLLAEVDADELMLGGSMPTQYDQIMKRCVQAFRDNYYK